jgi:HK97 family phage major capsid protein
MELQDTNDAAVLAKRGYRQLTSQEKKFYEKFINAAKSVNPKQEFTAIIGSDKEEDLMPTTIIQDVYKDLQEEYPLLKAIRFQNVGYITKWILNDHATQLAVWGQITDEITKEINSAFRVIDIDQNKLSAYAMIEIGMLDLGPVFIDGYIRACLKEAMLGAMEVAIVSGNGVNQPIGLIRDIHEGVSYSSTTGYPAKTAVSVNDFSPASYGALVAQMAVTEKGKKRRFAKVGMIVNQTDYLTKVMPATTVLNANGTYVNNLFPFPTTVYVSNAVDEGKAVLFLENEYFLGVGGAKNGVIEYSDEYKWLEDMRVFKVKQYGTGRATDNTCALYLDISKLEPAYITVKNHEVVTA